MDEAGAPRGAATHISLAVTPTDLQICINTSPERKAAACLCLRRGLGEPNGLGIAKKKKRSQFKGMNFVLEAQGSSGPKYQHIEKSSDSETELDETGGTADEHTTSLLEISIRHGPNFYTLTCSRALTPACSLLLGSLKMSPSRWRHLRNQRPIDIFAV